MPGPPYCRRIVNGDQSHDLSALVAQSGPRRPEKPDDLAQFQQSKLWRFAPGSPRWLTTAAYARMPANVSEAEGAGCNSTYAYRSSCEAALTGKKAWGACP
jgi:hypothetical protein